MITLNHAHAKSANINLHKKEVTITLVMMLDDESRRKAEDLAFYIGKGPLTVVVNPQQQALPLPGPFDHLPIEK
jgi:hypothetical protein